MRLLTVFFLCSTLIACTPSNPLTDKFENTSVTTVPSPVGFAFTPDGRMLIGSKAGTLYVYKDRLETALTLTDICENSERGLLGVAVDPEFATNKFVYLYYTFKNGTECQTQRANVPVNRVSRFVLEANTIDPASEEVLIDNVPSFGGNHNAGDVQFGKDGYLYISTGDGGCDYTEATGCAGENAIARDNYHLLGKILRLTKDGAIPPNNPFTGSNSARCNETGSTATDKVCQEIFAIGLRNPFRIAFDPNASEARFYINDVGQDVWEEINVGASGADYGWNLREGKCANGSDTACDAPPPLLTDPIFAYKHFTNPQPSPFQNCNSITAGAFVPNGIWPESYDGTYLFADVTCGSIFSLNTNGEAALFAEDVEQIVHMAFGPYEGGQALYYSSLNNGGEIRRIVFTSATK